MDVDIEALLEAPFQKQESKDSIKPMLVEEDSTTQNTPEKHVTEESHFYSEEQIDSKYEKERRKERKHKSRRSHSRSRSREKSHYYGYEPRSRSREQRREERYRSERDYRERDYRLEREYREDREYRSSRRSPRYERDERRTEGSYEREERSRQVSYERDEKRRDRSYDRDDRRRERSYDRDERRSRRSSRDRSPRPLTPVRESTPPLIVDPVERDRRTVFCMQLAARLTSRELGEFLRPCGRIREAKIVMDKVTRRSKGVAYVEFYDESSVPKAISMTGERLLGIPIIIQASESEKNKIEDHNGNIIQVPIERPPPPIVTNTLYVGSLHPNATEVDLRNAFERYGTVEKINLHFDAETGKSKGFAFIHYRSTSDARYALNRMNHAEILGKPIKVGPIEDKQLTKKNLDEGDHNVSLNSLSRVELMAKLARDDVRTISTHKPVSRSGSDIQTCFIVLKNMFDPAKETDPNWDKEIEKEVKSECTKYGKIRHIAVDPKSKGHIYIKFDSVDSARAAVRAINGRYFDGKTVLASYVSDAVYYAAYPAAASK
ncbi:hypothetical protein HDV06_000948 [Boothiomyces sp. JEL0866]|nr:hypothetical protein HDV06_000948 [Boothiomyces sp. JEL0866]